MLTLHVCNKQAIYQKHTINLWWPSLNLFPRCWFFIWQFVYLRERWYVYRKHKNIKLLLLKAISNSEQEELTKTQKLYSFTKFYFESAFRYKVEERKMREVCKQNQTHKKKIKNLITKRVTTIYLQTYRQNTLFFNFFKSCWFLNINFSFYSLIYYQFLKLFFYFLQILSFVLNTFNLIINKKK